MDIFCATCGEPFDSHHLKHDAIYETDLGSPVIELFEKGMYDFGFKGIKDALKSKGYVYHGESILALISCPYCLGVVPEGREKEAEIKKAAYGILEGFLGSDEDGLASELNSIE